MLETPGLECHVFCFFSHFLRPRKLSEFRQQSEDIKSVFTEPDKMHTVFHHRESSRKIRWLVSYAIFREAFEDIRQEMKVMKRWSFSSARLDGRYYLSPSLASWSDSGLKKGKTICSTPRFYLNSNLRPSSDVLTQEVNRKGKR